VCNVLLVEVLERCIGSSMRFRRQLFLQELWRQAVALDGNILSSEWLRNSTGYKRKRKKGTGLQKKLGTLLFQHSTRVMKVCRKLSKFMVRPGYKTAAFLTRFRLIADNCSFMFIGPCIILIVE